MKAGRIPPASREAVISPPPGWRKVMPFAVKLQVVINQSGRAPDGTVLDAIGEGIEFDHRPCLAEREYDPNRNETIPAANDPAFIVALSADAHHKQSGRDGARMKKTARMAAAEAAHHETLRRKMAGQKREAKGTIASRPFRYSPPSTLADHLALWIKPTRERIHIAKDTFGTDRLTGMAYRRLEILLDGVKYRCNDHELDQLYQGRCPEDLDLERIDDDDEACNG